MKRSVVHTVNVEIDRGQWAIDTFTDDYDSLGFWEKIDRALMFERVRGPVMDKLTIASFYLTKDRLAVF